ncbi:unnamed protein product [Soboliphyme baturini]|uniref:Coatomer subunit delta n=1 Tax=Soboliphyme baturini TaxID=241478 RepID=A0A183ICQ7_9BILA|nr:unnamed protein product [Soboliphyme baturini]
MSRSRIEGLLTAFPKLLSAEKSVHRQHTFLETDSVRYVYQPIDKLYIFLVTTKNSNILEDLETLRLFSRVIPEYCHSVEEKVILENCFELIFAFDEIVALGYRENVNLAQIRTFTDMDSHEERVYYQIKKNQEEEAKKLAKDKAKEFMKAKQEAMKRGGRGVSAQTISGYGPQSARLEPAAVSDVSMDYKPSKPVGSGKAMHLGRKAKDFDFFASQLKSEGQGTLSFIFRKRFSGQGTRSKRGEVPIRTLVHVQVEEKLNFVQKRDGGIQNFEVHGIVTLRISDDACSKIRIQMESRDSKGIQLFFQTHPNLDKKLFQTNGILSLKSLSKPFPVNSDISVLKWRFQSTEDTFLPFSINCWPSETSSGCEVSIEYTLENEDMELNNVQISIPLPPGTVPTVGDCDGEYRYDKSKNTIHWILLVIDKTSKQGSLDFTTSSGHPDSFFPVIVRFTSLQQFCDIKPISVTRIDDDAPLPFSEESVFVVDKYEVI